MRDPTEKRGREKNEKKTYVSTTDKKAKNKKYQVHYSLSKKKQGELYVHRHILLKKQQSILILDDYKTWHIYLIYNKEKIYYIT